MSRTDSLLARWPGAIAVISLAQLLGTSLWFSANGAGPSLMVEWQASASDIGWLTSAVQIGFILGTLVMSLSGLADRFRATAMFVAASIAGAAFNSCFAWFATGVLDAAIYRFLVGVALAGIYPIGMKLLVSWVAERRGWGLSLLVGMLTLGTALPHGMRWGGAGLDWRIVASASSILALAGAVLVHLLGDGPYGAKPSERGRSATGWSQVVSAFRVPAYRAAAFGYFGHMWELYAFWTVLPLLLAATLASGVGQSNSASALAFLVIAAGTPGCILGGLLSMRVGSARVAAGALLTSGLSGTAFLLGWRHWPDGVLVVLLVIWGASVVADSPHFSALSAQACDPGSVGTALAIQNSLGFALTIVSISAVTALFERVGPDAAWLLVAGPLAGLRLLRPALHPDGTRDLPARPWP